MWSLPVRQAVKVNGATYERPANPYHASNDAVIISTDANPSPGLSRVSTISTRKWAEGSLTEHRSADCFPDFQERHLHHHTHPRYYRGCCIVLSGNCYPACYDECNPSTGTWFVANLISYIAYLRSLQALL